MKEKVNKYFLIVTITVLYLVTSLISTYHVIDFFEMSNPYWLAVTLAIAFEIGAAATLAALTVLDKINKTLIWILFIILTLVQINGNLFYAYSHIHDYQNWVELFGLVDAEIIEQKRILAVISGAILPLVSLGFIKSLVDYLRPSAKPVWSGDPTKPHPVPGINCDMQGNPITTEWTEEQKQQFEEKVAAFNASMKQVQEPVEEVTPEPETETKEEPKVEEITVPEEPKIEEVKAEEPTPEVPQELSALDKIMVFKNGNK